MTSLNKVQLIGNLGSDAELRLTAGGTPVASVSLTTSDAGRIARPANLQEHTEWHRLVFYGRLAEIVGEYTGKGASIFVEGKMRTRKWEDKDGRDVYTTEVVADEPKLLSRPASEPAGEGATEVAPAQAAAAEAKKVEGMAKPATPSDRAARAPS